jgi:putative ABC transport system substrate-binding protein
MPFNQLKRREFITLLGGAAAWPLSARAQQPAIPVVGYLYSGTPDANPHFVAAFRQGLKDTGHVEGTNVTVEYRWAAGRYDRLPELAADLVRRQVAVIAVPGNLASAVAAKAATTTIPILFAIAGDPVKTGLVASINRPGGNLTGMNFYNAELGAKRLELLREMRRPRLVGVLFNPSNPEAEHELKDIEAAARALGQRIILLNASSSSDIDTAFATLVEMKGDALISTADTLFNNRRVQIVSLAARHAIPAIYVSRDWVAAGGLMSYGALTADAWRQVGIYAGRILKGEKAAELPVVQPTKFEFVINLQTAKLLGLDLSPMLIARADEVIE